MPNPPPHPLTHLQTPRTRAAGPPSRTTCASARPTTTTERRPGVAAGPYEISGGCGADNSGDPSIPWTPEEIFVASPGDPCYRGNPLIVDGGAEDWDAEKASSPNPG